MAARTLIRDTLVIDEAVQRFYDAFAGEEPVVFLGRNVLHAPGKVLRLSGTPLLVIADRYDSGDGMIDGRGVDSPATGAVGASGRNGQLVNERPDGPGGDGGRGRRGGDGGFGTSISLLCRTAGAVHVRTTGGRGAAGGTGGSGGRGVDGFFVFSGDPENPGDEIVPGTRGGFGGPGGRGGDGGVGGDLVFICVDAPVDPVLVAGGGFGGPGGFGGTAGEDGARTNEFACPPDEGPGCRGPSGESGDFTDSPPASLSVVSAIDFDGIMLATLGPLRDEWAEHRARVGEYFFRQYNAAIPNRRPLGRMAAHEFRETLVLQSGNAKALALQALLGGNGTPLGLARDLDLIPRFEAYIDAFARFGALTLDVLTLGTTALLSDVELTVLRSFAGLRVAEAEAMVAEAHEEEAIAKQAHQFALDEIAAVQRRLDGVRREIEAAIPRMRGHEFGIGDIVGPLAAVAVAVVGVIGAVFTAGASLAAVVPALVALTSTLIDQGEPVVKAVFEGDDDERKEATKKYEEVGKDFTQVAESTQTVVNFVKLVERLGAGSQPQTAPQVALIKQGAELAHELLLAQHRVMLADSRNDAAQARQTRAAAFAALAARVASEIDAQAASVRAAGLLAIEAARSKVDLLLSLAFQAQRSLEIYTLEDHEADVLYDAGSIHPDIERGYAEGFVSNADLLIALNASWARLLEPANMQQDFLAFFSNPDLDSDVLRLPLRDRAFLHARRTTGAATFRLEPGKLPSGRFDTKVVGVAVALVGAISPDGVVSTEIEHLGRYEQRRRDGSIDTQILRPRRSTRLAPTRALELPGVDFSTDPPLTAPQQLAFWGRGVAGEWTIRITPDQSGADEQDFGGLTEVQLWIKYQFLR
jgi:hypothetical protein